MAEQFWCASCNEQLTDDEVHYYTDTCEECAKRQSAEAASEPNT